MLVETQFFYLLQLISWVSHPSFDDLLGFCASFYHSFSQELKLGNIDEQEVVFGISSIDFLCCLKIDLKDAYFSFFDNLFHLAFVSTVIVSVDFPEFHKHTLIS